ncbi:MAG TPA: hypothetical protein VGM10_13835 [Actinocrinis sp.]|jgi:hypothetical protein
MKHRSFLIAAGFAVVLMSAAAPSALAATAAPGTTSASASHSAVTPASRPVKGTTICAHTNTAYCVDVVGNNNSAGAKLWLYPNGADDKWNIVLSPQGCQWDALSCYWIEDAQNTSLCMSATGTNGAPIELEKCNDVGGWYDEGDYMLGNGAFGSAGNLDAQAIGTHDYLYALNWGSGGKYNQFTVFGFN